jgi:hypothetical protein
LLNKRETPGGLTRTKYRCSSDRKPQATPAEKIESGFNDADFGFDTILRRVKPKSIEVLNQLANLVEEQYPTSYVASLFKNATKCKTLVASFDTREPQPARK